MSRFLEPVLDPLTSTADRGAARRAVGLGRQALREPVQV